MRKQIFNRVLALLVAVVLMVGVLPLNVIALDFAESVTDDYYKLISKNDYDLAPGITESEIVLNNADGSHRQVAHVVEVDINNPYTQVIPSYRGMVPTAGKYGVQIMSQQAAYAEANGYGNVVAAMNLSLSWYDSAYYLAHPELVGEPLGYMVLNGEMYVNSQGKTSGAQTCLVINFDEKDGVARPDSIPKTEIRSTSSAITGWEEQVIPANFGFLVKNGVNQYSKDHNAANGASRSFVGIKADGSIIMVMNDGRQSPYSTGFTNYEMAEFMLSLGCVQAVNGDGGGSSAFLSQRPGEELKINCSPSDGAERETTHGILVISTAPATGEFVQAHISADDDYFTPNSSVQFTAIGTDLVGTAADIPEDVIWQLADTSFGSIDQNGVFVSNGKEGAVTVQMAWNGEIVGDKTINIVMPDTLTFGQTNMTIPYGKSVDVALTASYNSKNVVLKASDVEFVISNPEIGMINGFNFVAAEEGVAVTEAILTATVGTVSVTANISLGKGSVIAYDFEDGSLNEWAADDWYGQYGPVGPNGKVTDDNGEYWYNGQNELGSVNVVTSANGKVKNGRYALALNCDFSQIYETGYHGLKFYCPEVDCSDAIAVGFWMYVPYDARHAEIRIIVGGSASTVYDNGQLFNLEEGWHYIKLDISNVAKKTFSGINIQIDDRACSSTGSYYDYITEPNLNGKYTFYIDDITVDYSTAVEDREAPIFSAPTILDKTGETSAKLSGQTIDYNTVTFEALVVEDTSLTNAVGIDEFSAKAYVDGALVPFTYKNGKFTVPGLVLADGIHTVKFAIADKMGNESWVSGVVNVQTGSDYSTIKVVPKDPDADRLLVGSLYWMDIIATDIETIEKVELVFDLNNASSWELAGMKVAEGFVATYGIQADDNIATIIIERAGKNTMTGEAVLASFPVRTWTSTITECEGYEDQTPAKLVSRGIIWAQSIELNLERGVITYVDSYESDVVGSFGMDTVLVDTELFFTNYSRKSVDGAQAWIDAKKAAGLGWHEHVCEAVEDLAPTCMSVGYTGRTYCAECDSIVSWGEEEAVAGHSFGSTDGVHTCEDCGNTYCYANGEAQIGWQNVGGNVYYCDLDGIVVNGTVEIDGISYEFEGYKLTAPTLVSDGVAFVGWWAGEQLAAGWHTLNGKQYYVVGIYVSVGISKVALSTDLGYRWYAFDENGAWLSDYNGLYNDGDEIIYAVNGVATYAGLVRDAEGNYYYINSSYKAVKDCTYGISESKANGLLPAGEYQFGADGKLIKNGLFTDIDGEIRYYVDDVATYAGLVKFNGNYYYINSTLKAVKNCTYGISSAKTNGLLPVGEYQFGADGKLIIKNGLVTDDDGEIRYYVNSVATYAGLVQDAEGNYYYVNSTLKAVRNCKYYITRTNGLLSAGEYQFDADGKMVVKSGLVTDDDGVIRYYVDGVAVYAGLVQDTEGNYYYVNSTLKAVRNCKYYITRTNGLLSAGEYQFDADGKLIIKNGLVTDDDGEIRYYENGIAVYAGLIQDTEGNYYYINSTLKAVKGSYTIYEGRANGLFSAEDFTDIDVLGQACKNVEFDENGRMIAE